MYLCIPIDLYSIKKKIDRIAIKFKIIRKTQRETLKNIIFFFSLSPRTEISKSVHVINNNHKQMCSFFFNMMESLSSARIEEKKC